VAGTYYTCRGHFRQHARSQTRSESVGVGLQASIWGRRRTRIRSPHTTQKLPGTFLERRVRCLARASFRIEALSSNDFGLSQRSGFMVEVGRGVGRLSKGMPGHRRVGPGTAGTLELVRHRSMSRGRSTLVRIGCDKECCTHAPWIDAARLVVLVITAESKTRTDVLDRTARAG
jgi:hypothetical protein